jgi:hypothetical protein
MIFNIGNHCYVYSDYNKTLHSTLSMYKCLLMGNYHYICLGWERDWSSLEANGHHVF